MLWADTTSAVSGLNKTRRVNVQLIHVRNSISMKKILILTCILLAAGAVSLRAADAKETYTKDCAKCHGEDGKGKTKMGEKLGVKDYTDAKVQSEMKDEKMVKAIKEGIKADDKTKMKAFSDLSDDEVKGLVAYVRAFKK